MTSDKDEKNIIKVTHSVIKNDVDSASRLKYVAFSVSFLDAISWTSLAYDFVRPKSERAE